MEAMKGVFFTREAILPVGFVDNTRRYAQKETPSGLCLAFQAAAETFALPPSPRTNR